MQECNREKPLCAHVPKINKDGSKGKTLCAHVN